MADTLSEKLREWEKRTAQAEQDLTAARATLREIRVEAAMGAYTSDGTIGGGLTALGCLDIVSACDAALAASRSTACPSLPLPRKLPRADASIAVVALVNELRSENARLTTDLQTFKAWVTSSQGFVDAVDRLLHANGIDCEAGITEGVKALLAHVQTLERRLADALAGNEVLRQDIEDAKEAVQAEQTRALLLGPVITQLQRERDGATAQGKAYKERALAAEQENARLTADLAQMVASNDDWHATVGRVVIERDQAEQQRDAAHAALEQANQEIARLRWEGR